MMNLNQYFADVLNNRGFDAWEKANDDLVILVNLDNKAWETGKTSTFVIDWAKKHNIDLSAGFMLSGRFITYFDNWCMDFLND